MPVYDVYGHDLGQSVYALDSSPLNQAYDINGNPLFTTSSGLVVMSYNVQWFSELNANQEMQTEIIETYLPNIIGLQELSFTNSMPALGQVLFSDYPYSAIGTQQNKSGIVSKIALSGVTSVLYSTQASADTRGYQKAYFQFNGKTICWLNTHLETSSYESAKVAQAHELFEAVQNEDYFIITGDFNTVCKSVNDTEYTTIMKQFIDAGYHSANCSEQHGFIDTWTGGKSASSTWYPCDHVITSANIDIDNVIVDTSKIDVAAITGQTIDHLPIIAYLTID